MTPLEVVKNLNALYVEDEPLLREETAKLLTRYFAHLHVADNGKSALEIFEREPIHIVITDLKMPVMGGLTLAKEIRRLDSRTPIFITSGYAETEDLLQAVKLNFVDYLLKPIDLSKLRQALVACVEKLEENGELFVRIDDNVSYSALKKNLLVKGSTISLTSKESCLLELLLKKRGSLVSQRMIESVVYGDEEMSEAALKNLLLRLRKKIGHHHIRSVRSMGVILETPSTQQPPNANRK